MAFLVALSIGCGGTSEDDPSDDNVTDALTTAASFQNGVSPSVSYQGTTDTTLSENTPTTTAANDAELKSDADAPEYSGKHVSSLLRFALDTIPKGSSVKSASLTVNVRNSSSGSGFAFYRVQRSWNADQATWVRSASGASWSTPGAGGADRGPIVTTVPANATGKITLPLNAAGIAAVQAWVDDPSNNDGLLLDSPTDMDGLSIDSAQATTPTDRPRLNVSYDTPEAGGTGLLGEYYTGTSFDALVTTRTDPTVDFDWGSGSPASALPVNNFSVRWRGQVKPLYSQTYTFYTSSDDGVRLWVGGKLVIDNWTDHGSTENSGTIALTAGQKVDVKLEYYEKGGSAEARLSWSSSSQPKQIIPQSLLFAGDATPPPPPPPGPLAGLDPTGKTIPDTNYTIPNGAIFLASNGSDANAGTQSAPVATLNRAIALVPAGGTIVVRGGVYRDWYNNGSGNYKIATKSLTIQAYPHEQPWFDGTDVVAATKWTADGAGHWYTSWSTPQFCDGGYYSFKYNEQPTSNQGPCSHYDMYRDPANPAASDPQMVFIDGVNQHEVTSLGAATAGNFFYDWSARRIYIATNPAGRTVELAARANAFVGGGAGVFAFKGVGFRRYATNEYENLTGAALYFGATGTTIENCVFTEMAAGALALNPRGAVLRHSVLARNGFTAAGGNGHSHTDGLLDGLLIENNIVSENNTERFGTDCTVSCAQGGIKNAHVKGFTVKNNLFANNYNGSGYWCDYECVDGVITNNVSYGNDVGIFLEVGNRSIIASNLTYNNTESGIRLLASNTKVYNNTIVGNGKHDIWVYDDSRDSTPVVPNTVNVAIENNIIYSTVAVMNVYASNSQTGPNTYFSALDYNSYFRADNQCSKRVFDWQDAVRVPYKSIAALTADRGWESHAHDICTGADPFFVDYAAKNFNVRSSSVAYKSGKPLPSDVAAALGVAAGSVHSRGAIDWVTR